MIKPESVIRSAVESDMPAMLSMARRFVNESSLPLTFDARISEELFRYSIDDDKTIILVEEYEGVLTGGILGVVHRDFCVEASGYVTKMYIEKEFRGLGTARDLISAFEDEAVKLGAKVLFASATAGMGERVEKLYTKLFEKYGYNTLGRVLVKEI